MFHVKHVEKHVKSSSSSNQGSEKIIGYIMTKPKIRQNENFETVS